MSVSARKTGGKNHRDEEKRQGKIKTSKNGAGRRRQRKSEIAAENEEFKKRLRAEAFEFVKADNLDSMEMIWDGFENTLDLKRVEKNIPSTIFEVDEKTLSEDSQEFDSCIRSPDVWKTGPSQPLKIIYKYKPRKCNEVGFLRIDPHSTQNAIDDIGKAGKFKSIHKSPYDRKDKNKPSPQEKMDFENYFPPASFKSSSSDSLSNSTSSSSSESSSAISSSSEESEEIEEKEQIVDTGKLPKERKGEEMDEGASGEEMVEGILEGEKLMLKGKKEPLEEEYGEEEAEMEKEEERKKQAENKKERRRAQQERRKIKKEKKKREREEEIRKQKEEAEALEGEEKAQKLDSNELERRQKKLKKRKEKLEKEWRGKAKKLGLDDIMVRQMIEEAMEGVDITLEPSDRLKTGGVLSELVRLAAVGRTPTKGRKKRYLRRLIPHPDTSFIDPAVILKKEDGEEKKRVQLQKDTSVTALQPILDPGIEAALAYEEPAAENLQDEVGDRYYMFMCQQLGVMPSKTLAKRLDSSTLNLRYYGIDPRSMRAIAEALFNNTCVKKLDFEDNWLTRDCMLHLCEVMRMNDRIIHLNLTNCRIGPTNVWKLSEILQFTQSLQLLDLAGNGLGDDGLKVLMTGFIENCTIKKLDLSHNNLGINAGALLGASLDDNWVLEDLNIAWNNLHYKEGFKKLCEGLCKNHGITKLNLAGNALSSKDAGNQLRGYLTKNKIVQDLDLSFNRFQEPALQPIKAGLAKNESLRIIRLGNNPILHGAATDLIEAIAKSPSGITLLDLDNLWVTPVFLEIRDLICQEREFAVNVAGVVGNYIVQEPNKQELALKRARFEATKPKKKKQKKEFGHFLMKLGQMAMKKDDFAGAVKKEKVKLSDTLVDALITAFLNEKKQVNINEMIKYYLHLFPDTPPLPVKQVKEKKGKRKGGKKGKGKKRKTDGEGKEEQGENEEGAEVAAAATEAAVAVAEVLGVAGGGGATVAGATAPAKLDTDSPVKASSRLSQISAKDTKGEIVVAMKETAEAIKLQDKVEDTRTKLSVDMDKEGIEQAIDSALKRASRTSAVASEIVKENPAEGKEG